MNSIQPEKVRLLHKAAKKSRTPSIYHARTNEGKCPQILPGMTPMEPLQWFFDSFSGPLVFFHFLKLGLWNLFLSGFAIGRVPCLVVGSARLMIDIDLLQGEVSYLYTVFVWF